jgi:hypothetical protein
MWEREKNYRHIAWTQEEWEAIAKMAREDAIEMGLALPETPKQTKKLELVVNNGLTRLD